MKDKKSIDSSQGNFSSASSNLGRKSKSQDEEGSGRELDWKEILAYKGLLFRLEKLLTDVHIKGEFVTKPAT